MLFIYLLFIYIYLFQYLTTVIPYDVGHGPPDNQSLQILNKSEFGQPHHRQSCAVEESNSQNIGRKHMLKL